MTVLRLGFWMGVFLFAVGLAVSTISPPSRHLSRNHIKQEDKNGHSNYHSVTPLKKTTNTGVLLDKKINQTKSKKGSASNDSVKRDSNSYSDERRSSSISNVLASKAKNILSSNIYKQSSSEELEEASSLKSGHYKQTEKTMEVSRFEEALLTTIKDRQTYKPENATLPVAQIEDVNFIMYNRVPKCGSTTTLGLIKKLSRLNGFYVIPEGPGLTPGYRYNKEELSYYLEDLARYPAPLFHSKHLHFVDFTRHHQFKSSKKVLYINIVRDPVERLASWYYFIRFNHKRPMHPRNRLMKYDDCVKKRLPECVGADQIYHLIPFFCGHDDICRIPSRTSLELAKKNIKAHYALVGSLERLADFYRALEAILPKYFRGIRKLYEQELEKGHAMKLRTKQHRPVGSSARQIMTSLLSLEYELYNFILERFQELVDGT